jgi:hypothetical protein
VCGLVASSSDDLSIRVWSITKLHRAGDHASAPLHQALGEGRGHE